VTSSVLIKSSDASGTPQRLWVPEAGESRPMGPLGTVGRQVYYKQSVATGNEFPQLCIGEAYSRCKNSFSPCLLFTTRSIPPRFYLRHGPLKCYSSHSSTSALSPSLITTTSSHSRRFCAVLTSYGEAQRCACSLASSAAQACGGR
jgi:hypothetical protein